MQPGRLPLSFALVCATAIAVVTGCTRVPEIEERVSDDLRSAPYPALIPLHSALEPLPSATEAGASLEEALNARRDRLQRRADRLRNTEG